MKDYIIKEVDGHHIVRMLTDEEMKFKAAAEAFMQFGQNLYDTVKETVENMVTGIRAWVVENNIIELLEEYENEINTREVPKPFGETIRIRQQNSHTQLGRLTDGVVHGTHRMGEHARTL